MLNQPQSHLVSSNGTGGARIVVVDDSRASTEALVNHMRLEGFQASAYNDPVQGLQAIRADPPDLVLLDVMMPGMDGISVLKALRAQPSTAELPVILLTALDETDDIVRGLDLGASDYLTKPPQLDVLAARIRTQLKIKHLQDQREKDIVQLRELSALKDKFLQIAAHDLRNPLNNISIGISVLDNMHQHGDLSNGKIAEDVGAILGTLRDAVNIMRSIVNDFLDLQAIRSGKLELNLSPTRINDTIRSVISQYAAYAEEKDISVRTSLDDALTPTLADPDRLTQVIANLISNAIKFSPPGGVIGVRTRNVNRRQLIEVADNGPGIAEEDIPLLFEEFSRVATRPTAGEESSGLGLSIARHLVELHGGRIGVKSRVGHGSLFWVELPVRSP